MNIQQRLLFFLLCTIHCIKINAMDHQRIIIKNNQSITFNSAKQNFNISWELLSNIPQYHAYRKAESDHKRDNTVFTGLMLRIQQNNVLKTQESRNFFAWYNFIQSFNQERKRTQSAPPRPYKRTSTITPIGSERLCKKYHI